MAKNSGRLPPVNPEHRDLRLIREEIRNAQLQKAHVDTTPNSEPTGRAGHVKYQERLFAEAGNSISLKPGSGRSQYEQLPKAATKQPSKDELWKQAREKARQQDINSARSKFGMKPI